ncbi:fibronectin type III domain-containing protein [Ferruginibacter lapsinanis]|uniref:fibronectin type III domain-containing protein n=1 Tax=Ferruginibacter lapsinanis TaxID=563172 RepID=UPI001E3165CA|nr:fibronectin type III domain-containing protein [Ferruginibacter lapsinanis]UEG49220.1 fibronectin type III domain-containing protein [Ferruginibacter lapsinanis]
MHLIRSAAYLIFVIIPGLCFSQICNVPTNIKITSLTTTSIGVQWNIPAGNAGATYDWEARTSGLAAGSGNTGLINSGNTADTFINVSSLTAATTYDIYVRTACTSSTSAWAGPVSIKTACTINSIPFSENFDGVTAPALPNCFTVQNINGGNTFTNTSLSGSFAPYSSPNAIIYATEQANAANDWIYTPAINLTQGVYYRMQFWYRVLFAGFPNQIEIKFGKAPVASAMTSGVIYSNSLNNTSLQQASFSYTVPQTGIYYIGIHNYTPAGAYNFQMLLDNLFIDIGPDPNCGIATNFTADSIGTNKATIRWTSPSSGTPVSYDWEVRTSGLPGSGFSGLYNSGNIAAADSINLSGLAMGTTYKFYLKTNCTSPSYGVWSGATTFTTNTTACGSIANLSYSNVRKDGFLLYWGAPSVSSPSVGYDWEVRLSGAGGSGATGLVTSGTTTNTFADVTGLQPLTYYSVYVRNRCASGNSSSWVKYTGSISTGIINEVCSDAVELIVGKGFCTSIKTIDLSRAVPTTGLSSSCALINNGSGTTNPLNDAWYKVTVPATGNVVVQTFNVPLNASNTGISAYNSMLIAYSGDCGNLTEIACDRDGGPDDPYWASEGYQAKISLTGRTPGETIYFRMLPDALNSQYVFFTAGRLGIGAKDTTASVLPPISAGGNCVSNPSITVSSTVNLDDMYRWLPIFDTEGKIVAEIFPNNLLGAINTKVYTHSSDSSLRSTPTGNYLLNRNVSFTSQNNLSSGSSYVYIRIYFTKKELQLLKQADASVEYNLLQVLNTNTACSGVYAGTELVFPPTAFGKYGEDYYIEVQPSALNNFFISGGSLVSKICPGTNTTFVSNADEYQATYQWQVNTGSGFTNISNNSTYAGATTKTLQLTNIPDTYNGYQYRCLLNYVANTVSTFKYSHTFSIEMVNTWTGAVNNNWNVPGNWSCGTIPTINTDVKINSGNVVVNITDAVCNSLNIRTAAATITVSEGNKLTIVH